MNCAACGAELRPDFAFCPACGTKQPRLCGSCGYLCDPDFAFCPKCGASVDGARSSAGAGSTPSPSPPTGSTPPRGVVERLARPRHPNEATGADRRTVTVLFADLSGFTAISERLDPEIVQSLQNEIFEELTAAAENFGGFVDKFIGDAMLALFGAPVPGRPHARPGRRTKPASHRQ